MTVEKRPYQLRQAAANEQPIIKKIIRANRLNPLGIKWSRFIVAVDATNQIIGCGQIKVHRDQSLELASIAVLPEWRRQGVASAIIKRLLANQTQPIWLTCGSSLVPFYQPFGFEQCHQLAEMPPYFRRVMRLFNLFSRVTNPVNTLAVMVKPAPFSNTIPMQSG